VNGQPGWETGLGERYSLCAALVDLVIERGYPGLDAGAVCRHAGVAPGAFERHFDGLEECFALAWDELEGAYLARIAAVYEVEEDWRDKFRAGAMETARLVDAYPHPARFLAVAALSAGELGRARQRAFGSRIAALLDTAREQIPDPDAAPPEITSRWIVSIFFDRIYRRLTAPAGPDLVSQLPELMFLAISSYFGTEAGLAELDRLP
jgi:AcrR family transcriptional regulator